LTTFAEDLTWEKILPMEILAKDLFPALGSLEAFRSFFSADVPPWDWLTAIDAALESLKMDGGETDSFVHPSATISPQSTICGPVYIGAGTEVRPGAYVRGLAIIGKNCIIGNGCEIKHALVCDGAQIPHFNYVGDSILGPHSHLGAGAILANLRFDGGNVTLAVGGKRLETGRRKFGAAVGEGAQIGCNSVLRPGTVIGRNAIVYDGLSFGGLLPDGHCVRQKRMELEIVEMKRKCPQ
jgi:NDP-sugar pyrophosphorylase family protein